MNAKILSICTALWVGLSLPVLAQDEEAEPALAAESTIINKPYYIRDYIYVPLRSGNTSGHRIVHKGLKSGTLVTLLENDAESAYSRVQTSRGIEGWLPTQYLQEAPTAEIKLAQAEKTIEQLSSKAGPLSQRLLDSEKQNQKLAADIQQLERENNTLSKELDRIKELSQNVVQVDENNKELLKQNELLHSKNATLKAENQRLEDQLKREDFINGVLAVVIGIIATLAVQYLTRSRRRSEWG